MATNNNNNECSQNALDMQKIQDEIQKAQEERSGSKSFDKWKLVEARTKYKDRVDVETKSKDFEGKRDIVTFENILLNTNVSREAAVQLSPEMSDKMEQIGLMLLHIRVKAKTQRELIRRQIDFTIMVWKNACAKYLRGRSVYIYDSSPFRPDLLIRMITETVEEVRTFNDYANKCGSEEARLDLLHYSSSVINTLTQTKRLLNEECPKWGINNEDQTDGVLLDAAKIFKGLIQAFAARNVIDVTPPTFRYSEACSNRVKTKKGGEQQVEKKQKFKAVYYNRFYNDMKEICNDLVPSNVGHRVDKLQVLVLKKLEARTRNIWLDDFQARLVDNLLSNPCAELYKTLDEEGKKLIVGQLRDDYRVRLLRLAGVNVSKARTFIDKMDRYMKKLNALCGIEDVADIAEEECATSSDVTDSSLSQELYDFVRKDDEERGLRTVPDFFTIKESEVTAEVIDETDVKCQMEAAVLSEVAETVATAGSAFAGEAVKKIVGSSNQFDTATIVSVTPDDLAHCDVPRDLGELTFKKGYNVPNHQSIIQMKDTSFDIIERCRVRSLLKSVSWAPSAAAKAELFTIPVSPGVPYNPYGTNTAGQGTALSYFSLFYDYWRGELEYEIEIVATQMHQGQLFIAFVPGTYPNITYADAVNCICATIDIGEQNTSIFTVPFVSVEDYKLNTIQNGAMNDYSIWNPTCSTGVIKGFVQNPITAPPSVNTTVRVNVWIRAGRNFEFAVPRPFPYSIWITGTWQGGDEVMKNVETNLPAGQNISGIEFESPISAVTIVETANTENIVNREYLYPTNFSWASTRKIGDKLLEVNVPRSFFALTDTSILGLMKYHHLYRSGFEVTVRFSASRFYSGLAILYFDPRIRRGTANPLPLAELPTLTQLPHTFINIGYQTEGKLAIPWSTITRVMETNQMQDWGTIFLVVINPLFAPPSGISTIGVSLWFKAMDPYVGVKTTGKRVTTGYQGGGEPIFGGAKNATTRLVDGTTAGQGVTDRPWAGNGSTNPPGFIGKQTNVLDYLRKPDYAGYFPLGKSSSGNEIGLFGNVPFLSSQNHMKMLVTYKFWKGSSRYHITSPIGVSDRVIVFLTFDPTFPAPYLGAGNLSQLTQTNKNPVCFYPTVSWRPGVEPIKVVELPFYSRYPLCATNEQLTPSPPTASFSYMPGSLAISAVNIQDPGTYNLFLWHSVGDDFEAYFPLPMPEYFQQAGAPQAPVYQQIYNDASLPFAKPVPEHTAEEWIKDLTIEGIEPNPGPWYDAFTSAFIRTVAAGELERAKKTRDQVIQSASTLTDSLSKQLLPGIVWIMDFILNIHTLCSQACAAVKGMAIAALAAKLVLLGKVGESILKQLQEVFTPLKQLIGYQGGESDVGVVTITATALVTGLVGLLGYSLTKRDKSILVKHGESKYADMLRSASLMGNAARGVSNLWQFAKAGIEIAIEWIFGGNPVQAWWEDKKTNVLPKWQHSFDKFKTDGDLSPNKLFVGTIGIRPVDKFKKFLAVAHDVNKYGPSIKNFPVQYTRTAQEIINIGSKIKQIEDNSSPRMEPIGILISGEPGTGKTYFGNSILPITVLVELGLAANAAQANTQVFAMSRDPDQKHWDGYQNQPWVTVDDFGQATTDKDFEQIIHIISSSNCPVSMAHLEDKSTQFRSSFVCCDTNLSSFHGLSSIKTPQAASRRFPIHIKLSLRPGQTPKTFMRNLGSNPGAHTKKDFHRLIDDTWIFTLSEMGAVVVGDRNVVMGFEEVVDLIVNTYREKTGNVDKLKEVLTAIYQGGDEELPAEEEDDEATPLLPAPVEVKSKAALEEPDTSLVPVFKPLPPSVADYAPISQVVGPEEREEFADCNNYLPGYSEFDFDGDPNFDLFDSEDNSSPASKYFKGPKWKGMKEYISKLLAAAGIVLVSVGVIYLAITGLKSILTKFLSSAVSQGGSYDQRFYKGKNADKRGKSAFQNSEVADVFSRNIRHLYYNTKSTRYSMHAIALNSKQILVPKHFLKRRKKDLETDNLDTSDPHIHLEIRTKKGEQLGYRIISIDETNTEVIHCHNEQTDLIAVTLVNANVDHARDITKHLITREDWAKLSGSKRLVYMKEHDLREAHNGVADFSRKILINEDRLLPISIRDGNFTVDGDCGRPYFLENPIGQKNFIGMHSYVDVPRSSTYISPVIAEDVARAFNAIKERMYVSEHIEEDENNFQVERTEINVAPLPCNVEQLGNCKINGHVLERPIIERTEFVRSPLQHPEWPDDYLPTKKTWFVVGGERKHPLIEGSVKWDYRGKQPLSATAQQEIIQLYTKRIPRNHEARALTWHEAINGFGNIPQLVLKTSPGYWSAFESCGKRKFFTALPQQSSVSGELLQEDYDFSEQAIFKPYEVVGGKTFVQHLISCEHRAMNGEDINTFWVATLKDELRKKEKVDAGKTRVFEQPSLEYTILMRRYFGHFVNWFKENYGFGLMHSIGVDKDEVWGEYYRELTSRGDNVFDIDFSNYDGSVTPAACDFFLAVTDAYYGPEDRKVRHSLIHALRCAKIIVGKNLVQTTQGNKSGNPLTDVFNSVTNAWFILLCWKEGSSKVGLTINDFYDKVSCITYGDDIIATVDDDAKHRLNRKICAEVAEKIGMVVTSAAKTGEMVEFDSIKDCTFLKSKFVPAQDAVLCPLPFDTLYRELRWERRNNVGDALLLQQRIECALDMAVHMGKDQYDKLVQHLRDIGYYEYSTNHDYRTHLNGIRSKQLACRPVKLGRKNLAPDISSIPDITEEVVRPEEVEEEGNFVNISF